MEDKLFKFWLLPIVMIVLFLVSICNMQYGFYTFARICVCILSLILAYDIYAFEGSMLMVAINVVIAILWNPIFPIYLEKHTWVDLDIIASVFQCVNGIYAYKLWKSN